MTTKQHTPTSFRVQPGHRIGSDLDTYTVGWHLARLLEPGMLLCTADGISVAVVAAVDPVTRAVTLTDGDTDDPPFNWASGYRVPVATGVKHLWRDSGRKS